MLFCPTKEFLTFLRSSPIVINSLLASVTILPFSTVEAEQAAQIRATLNSQGQPIGAYVVSIHYRMSCYLILIP